MVPPRASAAGSRRPLSLLVAAFLLTFLSPPTRADEQRTLTIGGGTIHLEILGGNMADANPDIAAWIKNAARAVTGYFGRFPVRELRLRVRLRDGSGVHGGRANGWGRLPTINIEVGMNGGPRSLDNDWVLTHEMIHLGFPNVAGPHDWMGEGLATYAEPVARARLGTMSVERYWVELARDMPQGVPGPYDRGFNLTRSWESTYWGGALFWFLADVEIRQATGGKKTLEDALRAILREGGDIRDEWTANKIIEVGDRATGTTVLRKLYDTWALQRGEIDFSLLMRRLGVSRTGDRVTFNDHASLADMRKAFTRPPPPLAKKPDAAAKATR